MRPWLLRTGVRRAGRICCVKGGIAASLSTPLNADTVPPHTSYPGQVGLYTLHIAGQRCAVA